VDDKRVTIHLVDGRNFLLLTDQQYDAIVIELTSVWFANAGNLYNREFYELAAAHLKPEGIIQQWIQLHHIMPEDIMVAINTMRDVFPHVTFFQADMQGLIIGSKSPVTIDAGRVKNLEKQKDVRHLLRSMGKKTMLEFAANLIFDEQSINEMKNSQPDIVSTDDNLLIEYSTPKGNFLKAERRENLDVLLQFQKDSLIPVINMPEGFEQSITDEIAGYFSKRIVR
jgi:spermidine synthase